jgi:hypothetical protein
VANLFLPPPYRLGPGAVNRRSEAALGRGRIILAALQFCCSFSAVAWMCVCTVGPATLPAHVSHAPTPNSPVLAGGHAALSLGLPHDACAELHPQDPRRCSAWVLGLESDLSRAAGFADCSAGERLWKCTHKMNAHAHVAHARYRRKWGVV